MGKLTFANEKARFTLTDADMMRGLYFPIASELGIKSVVTPNLSGDSKLDQNIFILEPTSIENLHNNKSGRNFWCLINNDKYLSVVGNSAEAESKRFTSNDRCDVNAGFMWQTVSRSFDNYDITSEVTSYVPYNKNVEVMQVKITNTGSEKNVYTPVAAIPLYGRSADNIRDHRHVTSLLHRIRTTENGVLVRPTLSFDERGHQKNKITYFVCGITDDGQSPIAFYPTIDSFLGDAGTFSNPESVAKKHEGVLAGASFAGSEAVGAFRFADVSLAVGETKSYTIIIGATEDEAYIDEMIKSFDSIDKVEASLKDTEEYWNTMVNISVNTKDNDFNNLMRWVCFQPFLRRVYGCSFLPHHDYGKGGRGWRDLWQDCLALLIMDPSNVRQMILDNFGGVRIDGTNATIIGTKPGEFIADRNGITRVWMDHGMWPFLTTKLYLEQSGDLELLNIMTPYFKDKQVERGEAFDTAFDIESGNIQKSVDGKDYLGSVLEHLLLQHVCAILETGDHGIIKLRDADWNDALDMANDKGESVAFTCAYAGNLVDLAGYIRRLSDEKGMKEISVMEELASLIIDVNNNYENRVNAFEAFKKATNHEVTGKTCSMNANELADAIELMAKNMMEHVRTQEWISDSEGNSWFNSYYDNHGDRVEGEFNNNIRMMLTGQVFAIMSKTATDEQVAKICQAADKYLYEKAVGGYKLNTNFNEEKYDMGRAFGFAYGEKENGAVFSHMTVMYAYALYSRGFIKEGYKALQTLADTALDYETSHIYPGIPEYFNSNGRGLYHYLTGAASWYALTMVTQVFGVTGDKGNLLLAPKLVKEQFDDNNTATIQCEFAGKKLNIQYVYENVYETGTSVVKNCYIDNNLIYEGQEKTAVISRNIIDGLSDGEHIVRVVLSNTK